MPSNSLSNRLSKLSNWAKYTSPWPNLASLVDVATTTSLSYADLCHDAALAPARSSRRGRTAGAPVVEVTVAIRRCLGIFPIPLSILHLCHCGLPIRRHRCRQ
ncbi:hypothetical protein [Oryza sativa Japonica Group]|uniref:Uncharacterized protein n=1 Tax=Oryza sativa subsp. japonica TaxID=39947 RepID=Q5ZDU1_ORYSJ|nr:hypothetical protein [Oryza sativa Japonica Group]